jgi:hypothetical protein
MNIVELSKALKNHFSEFPPFRTFVLAFPINDSAPIDGNNFTDSNYSPEDISELFSQKYNISYCKSTGIMRFNWKMAEFQILKRDGDDFIVTIHMSITAAYVRTHT